MTALRVVLQARTTSTRLPAKALLPLAGMPSSILAAKRAMRDGLDLVFATSTDPTDDLLAATAAAAGLKVFRGSKDDVLGRYAAATADMADDDVIIRITGDDPVPDADFLRALVASRARRGIEMLFSMSPADGLPHGVAAQAFSVRALRDADKNAILAFEREHVGPWLVKNLTSAVFDDYAGLDLGHLRCTLDTLDDYFTLQTLFAGVADPIGMPWRALVEKLAAQNPGRGMPFRYLRGHPGGDPTVERLGALIPEIGAASSVDAIRGAIRVGATHLIAGAGDAARAVGAALAQGWGGRAAAILRLSPPADLARGRIADWIDLTLLAACRDLGLAKLYTVLLPDPTGARGTVLLAHLRDAQSRGLLRHIGVTVATPAAARKWLKRDAIAFIELACHPADMKMRGLASALAARPDVMMVARPPADALQDALGQAWAQGAVTALSSAWPAQIDAARTARP
jgi:spore coat polysaccharide biosynthesis protein SpsF